jgi:hypothetical protein
MTSEQFAQWAAFYAIENEDATGVALESSVAARMRARRGH